MSETTTIRISDIIIDPEINTRIIDTETVQEYKESIEGYGAKWQDNWGEYPRITKSKHLWSGAHTLTAAKMVFLQPNAEIKVIIEGEDKRDAYFNATRCNAQHGRRRTNAEKETAVMRWLEDPVECSWTDGHIAGQCQVSVRFVGKCRERAQREQPSKRRFINAKGDIEWIEISGISATPKRGEKKERKDLFNQYIKTRNDAYSLWEAYCKRWEVPFNWDNFCLYAEKYLDGRGCVSAINPDEAPMELIQQKLDTWQKMHDAIKANANWVITHRLSLEHQEYEQKRKDKTEEEPEQETETAEQIAERADANQRRHLLTCYNDAWADVWNLWDDNLEGRMQWTELIGYTQEVYPKLREIDADEADDESNDALDEQIKLWRSLKAQIQYVIPRIYTEIDEGTAHWLLKRVVKNAKPTPPPQPEPTEEKEEKVSLFHSEDTDKQIRDCKQTVSDLLEAEGLPLIIKFSAESLLETIEKYMLTTK